MITRFCELPVGARFEFRGRRYEKLAADMAGDEERCGNRFHENTECCHEGSEVTQRREAAEKPVSAKANILKAKILKPKDLTRGWADSATLPYVRKIANLEQRGRVWA